jgi:hypothetical protein
MGVVDSLPISSGFRAYIPPFLTPLSKLNGDPDRRNTKDGAPGLWWLVEILGV